jgi:type VI secretion system protein ImpH
MPTTQRRRHTSVVQRLLAQPHRFELIQTMRMLDLWLRRNGGVQGETLTRHVRFQNSISMRFPASQIEALSVHADTDLPVNSDQALQAALAARRLKYIRITPAYFGFLGASGVMPYRYTEDIAAQIQTKKYEGSRAFFDIFSNRIMALHYQAWAKYRVRQRADASDSDVLLPIQLAIGGLRPGSAAAIGDSDVSDEVPAYYAAMLRQRPASAQVIAAVLTEYFAMPVEVIQFIGKWDAPEQTSLCLVGKQNATLGMGAMLGARCWERQSRVELRIGPLSMTQYEQFLPGTSGYKALVKLISLFSLPTLEFQMRLVLRADEVKPVALGAPASARLGMGAFLVTTPQRVECDDLVYELHA